MQYYDEAGKLRDTRDERKARFMNAFSTLKSSSYGLHPEAAGRLSELLGPEPSEETREEALQRAREALLRSGLGDLDLSAVLRAVGGQWEMLIED